MIILKFVNILLYIEIYIIQKKYPLDSALFISLNDLYKYHDLRPQKDECCAGLFLFNLKRFSKKMENWFYKYDKNVTSITNNGDQTHFNFHVQNEKLDYWLDYRFQASWNYEMAWNYPFLYKKDYNRSKVIKDCIETSLLNNFFLHFAGNWPESKMWKTKNVLNEVSKKFFFK